MALSGSLSGLSKTLVARFGESATYLHHDPGNYDVESGTRATGTTQETVSVLFESYTAHELQSGRIEPGDRKCYISPDDLSEDPTGSDEIEVGSERWQVIAIDDAEIEGTAVLHTLQVRRSD